MKIYRRNFTVGILSLIFTFTTAPTLNAQEHPNKKEEGKVVVASDSKQLEYEKERLNSDIEKTIENEKFFEKEHQAMHEKDKPSSSVGQNRVSFENKYLKVGYGQISSEEAQKKLLVADTNIEHAEAALIRAEQKISAAKVDLLEAKKNNSMTEEALKQRQENILRAEAILKEAREKLKIDLRSINSKLQRVNEKQ